MKRGDFMKLRRIIRFFISLSLALILLFSISMPVFATPASNESAGGVGISFVIIIIILISPILLLFAVFEALFTGSGNFIEVMNRCIEEYLSMFGL